jgi:uncharacterized protein YecE (DUF72 family)
MATRALHIGTSGWSYRHWRGAFYPRDLPARSHLAFYAGHFASVELNGSFYRLPGEQAVRAWRALAPPGFLFAVKGSRFITHNKKLAEPEIHLPRFLAAMGPLGARFGPVLFQLPPRWQRNAGRLEHFLATFRALAPRRALAIEFRHPSWYHQDITQVLRRYHASFCISHLDGHLSPLTVTAPMVYLRLHGSGGRYAGTYGREGLAPWVAHISGWLADGRRVFCYFDNDIGAAAPADALLLQRLMETGGTLPDRDPAV